MTDLISTLADSLIALINSSPRSPRKDQIEDVLRKGIVAAVTGEFWSYPIFGVPDTPLGQERVTFAGTEDIPIIKGSAASDPTSWGLAASGKVVPGEVRYVRQSYPMSSYEAKGKQPCEMRWFGIDDGAHDWVPTGFDHRGLFCQVGASYDISEGKHLHCECGASKFIWMVTTENHPFMTSGTVSGSFGDALERADDPDIYCAVLGGGYHNWVPATSTVMATGETKHTEMCSACGRRSP